MLPFLGFIYWYLRYFIPLILTIGLVITLIAMAMNFGTKFGMSIVIFLLGIFVAGYIIYGKKIISLMFNFNSSGFRSFFGLDSKNQDSSNENSSSNTSNTSHSE